jgi:predicted molibdopterin-dependent oxidoreductase YjgC
MATSRRLDGDVQRGERVDLIVDGRPVEAYRGETVAAAMWAAGHRVFRLTTRTRSPRGLYCAMGVCFECLVTVDGKAGVRACMTPVEDGMVVSTGSG